MWIRLSSTQYELRAGLQKINFGSASIFRPLMWFDQMDARDPLQITDGVYGLLFRYYFVNNVNIWAWGLFGNMKTKGWEARPTRKYSLEYGARIQVPLFKGELAATYHRRSADFGEGFLPVAQEGDPAVPENRFGIDGKWDIGIGLSIRRLRSVNDVSFATSRGAASAKLTTSPFTPYGGVTGLSAD